MSDPTRAMAFQTAAGSILFALAAAAAPAASYDLMREGAPACSIVMAPEAGPVERHAAEELAGYLGKIAGGPAPAIGTHAADGTYPVRLSVQAHPGLDPEGFALKAGPDGLQIVGAEPIGVLYGAYEVLKRYGGIRWLVPGDDGEYFTMKPTIAVPEGVTVKNPDFAIRDIGQVSMSSLSLARDTWAWCSRNNMRLVMIDWQFTNPKLHDELEKRAVLVKVGGHCFTPLMTGWNVVKRTRAVYLDSHKFSTCSERRLTAVRGRRRA